MGVKQDAGASVSSLHQELTCLILSACRRPEDPQTVDPEAPLIGPGSPLGLDSLDVLQISLALTERFGVRLEDSKQARRALASVSGLARFLKESGAA
ncbi:MAG TPA: phosphopantetheine-binding protein [Acidiferrobacteraceae bacterium]|nr:phosphopantetheine-binding protein [Acidiferrobacteraceae bacterium]